jgi:hypothetical protein
MGASWERHALVWAGAAGYSSLVLMGGGNGGGNGGGATGGDGDGAAGVGVPPGGRKGGRRTAVSTSPSTPMSAPADLGVFYDRNNETMAVFEAQSVSFTAIPA